MKHCILIKWKDRQEAEEKYGEIRALFDGAVKIPGIAGVETADVLVIPLRHDVAGGIHHHAAHHRVGTYVSPPVAG